MENDDNNAANKQQVEGIVDNFIDVLERTAQSSEYAKVIDELQQRITKEPTFARPQDRPRRTQAEKKADLVASVAQLEIILQTVDPLMRVGIATLAADIVGTCFDNHEPLKSYTKIDKNLRILLGDTYFSKLEVISAEKVAEKIFDALTREASKPLEQHIDDLFIEFPDKSDGWLETVLPTLDMVFEQRYGWPAGKSQTMSMPDLCLALDHAIEHNDPLMPTIWEITK